MTVMMTDDGMMTELYASARQTVTMMDDGDDDDVQSRVRRVDGVDDGVGVDGW